MSYVIAESYLTRTVTVKRPQSESSADSSGLIGAPTTVSADTKIRAYRNEEFGQGTGETEQQGIVNASSHKGMALPDADINVGDILIDNDTSEEFKANLVDSMPAGYSGHHIELWLTSSDYL